jgi:hypothetical protein
MNNLPAVKFANSDKMITRLVSGGNPLCGNSHFSEELNSDMSGFFTEKPIDAVVVGMFPKYIDQINLNVKYTIDSSK